jgi:hypothetical protein
MCYVHDIVDIAEDVNIENLRGEVLRRVFRTVLLRILHDAAWPSEWSAEAATSGWDFTVSRSGRGGEKVRFCIKCKTAAFRPSQFASVGDPSCPGGKGIASARVLAVPQVSTRMAELLRQHKWSWYDLDGNCRLEVPGVLLIERSGRKSARAVPRSGANLGTPETARVVRALLAPENAGKRWTQREMVGHFADLTPAIAAPSLALVNKVVQHLRDQAFIESLPDRGFRVSDFDGLLQAWRQAYRFDRHVRRPYFTLLAAKALQEKLRSLDSPGSARLAYAAYSAADVQAPTVRQPRTWLYVSPDFEREFASAIDAKVVDSGENLVVLIPDDAGVFYRVDTGANRAPCTNAAQTYVDLAKAGGRGEEAAEAILSQRLKPAWAAAK